MAEGAERRLLVRGHVEAEQRIPGSTELGHVPVREWALQWNLRRLVGLAWGLGGFVLIVLSWQVITVIGGWPEYLFPSPLVVWESFYRVAFDTGELWPNIWASSTRVLLGYIPGIGGGLILGLMMGMSPRIGALFGGVVKFFNAIPALAWIPIAVLWFGIGYESVTFIIFLSVFFPVLFSTMTGVRSIPEEYLHVARMCEVGPFGMVWRVVIPGALPSIITGIRIGAGYGWRGMVAAEMIAASSGLGFMIFNARQFLQTDVVIVGMITIGLLWTAIDYMALRPVERLTVERWGMVR